MDNTKNPTLVLLQDTLASAWRFCRLVLTGPLLIGPPVIKEKLYI